MRFGILKSYLFTALIALFCAFPTFARADVQQLSEQEFRELAQELSKKVNLFHDVWEKDPEAVFYGGTSRDYLYWLKGKFAQSQTREQALAVQRKLLKLSVIDVRDFIVGESDVDIVSQKALSVEASRYGVRKIDTIATDIFDASTELGQNELGQGFVPVEKIRITHSGISQAAELGDGMHELYSGKLTVHFPDPKVFAQTKFAKEGLNHPVLLALRYLRLQGINYFNDHGDGLPDKNLIFAGFDPKSREETKRVIDGALDGKELRKLLENNKFRSWMNGTIQKSFRSYTNPTAALEILKSFGVDQFSRIYGSDKVEPVNQYVFQQYRDPVAIEKAMKEYRVNQEEFFRDPKSVFSDGYLYHGTKTEAAFGGILFQGVLPSEDGSGGKGLYGVAVGNQKFSEDWAGNKDRLLRFPVKEDAKIVDITRGEGARVYKKFAGDSEKFAEAFGVDIIRYPYHTEAFVVKNSGSLERAEGVHRQLMTLSTFLAKAREIQDPDALVSALRFNQVSSREADLILAESPIAEEKLVAAIESSFKATTAKETPSLVLMDTALWRRNAKRLATVIAPVLLKSKDGDLYRRALQWISDGTIPLTDELVSDIGNAIREQVSSSSTYGKARTLIEMVAENPHWPQSEKTIRAITHGIVGISNLENGVLLRVVKMLADARNVPMPNLGAGREVYPSKDAWTRFDSEVTNLILPHPDKAMVPEIEKLLNEQHKFFAERLYNNLGDDRFSGLLLEKWSQFPEVVGILAEHAAAPQIPNMTLYRWLMRHPEYPEGEHLIAELMLKHADDLGPLREEMSRAGWSKNIDTLRRIHETIDDSNSAFRFWRTTYELLLRDNLWEKDINFFLRSLPKTLHVGDVASILEQKNLIQYPHVMEVLVSRLNQGVFGTLEALTIARITAELAKPEWAEFPEILLSSIRTQSYDNSELIRAVLLAPAWGKHPELLEKFAARWPNKFLASGLLDLPHWRDNPAFAHLYTKGRLDAGKFWLYADAKNPGHSTTFQRLGVRCATWFSSLGGKK